MRLQLPPLADAACDTYDIEVLSSSHFAAANGSGVTSSVEAWLSALKGVRGETAEVKGLAPMVAHRFRLIAVGAGGRSAASEPSEPALTDAVHSKLLEPPSVSATSTSSFALSWLGKASPCRASQLSYALQMRRGHGTAAASAAWLTEKTSLPRAALALDETPCAEGCAFRYSATNVAGWSVYSRPSEPVRTHALAPLPPGAARLLVALSSTSELPTLDATPLADLVASELAASLGVPEQRVAAREARRGAKQAALTQVVIDLLPATDGAGAGGKAESSEALVGRLKTLVLTQVHPGVLTRALRAIGEISRLDADGHATVLVPSRELAAARKAAAQRDTTSGRALTFALLLVAVAIGGLVCSRNARKGGAAGRPTRRGPPARRRTRNEARPYDTVDHLGRPVLDGDEMESDDDDWNLNPSYSDGPSRAASSTSLAT